MPIVKTYYKVHRVFPDPDYVWLENNYAGDNTLTIQKSGTPASTDLSYSFDKNTWTDIHNGGSVTVPQGSKVYLRSSTGFSTSGGYGQNYTLNMSQSYKAGGHIASLFDYTDMGSVTAIPDYGCYRMFLNSTTLTSSEISFEGITAIGNSGCTFMYYGCSNMTGGCNMADVTVIGADGCGGMYRNTKITYCDFTSLTEVGRRGLGADGMGSSSYYGAFDGCSYLTDIIGFDKVTTITTSSFCRTFLNCTSLITGADLSGITSVSGDYACHTMYNGCSSLNIAIAPNISAWSETTFNRWLYGTAATGVVRKPAGLTIPTDSTNGVPTGWTTENY